MGLPKLYLTVDAGGTFLKSAVLDTEGRIVKGSAYSARSNSDGSREEIVGAFERVINKGMSFVQTRGSMGGLGIATPGPFDIHQATSFMKHKFQGIYGVNLREVFYNFSNVSDDMPTEFIHDVHAVLEGELWKGNARGFSNVAVVTLGTGLGFAISQSGEFIQNNLGGPDFSLYARPYRDGILEDYVSKRGFLKIYKEISGKAEMKEMEVVDIGRLADQGDPAGIQTFYEVGSILAESLRSVLVEKQIECLLFGGQISKSFRHMQAALDKSLDQVRCLRTISPVKNIDNAALIGTVKRLFKEEKKV